MSIHIENVSVVFGRETFPALCAADKKKSRAEIRAKTGAILGVHNCTLKIEEGKTLILMGLSGSGKSTLLRTINGLVKLSRGKVTIYNKDRFFCVKNLNSKELQYLRTRLVSMVFQKVCLLPWRNVFDNVGLGLEIAARNKTQNKTLIMKQLELVGLKEWAEKPVNELSGGMQQRVGLARAFVTGAPVLLMDEPFSALDPLIRGYLQNELLSLQKCLKKTIVFVSHDLNEAMRIGDKIAIMKDGHIIQHATPKEIVLHPINNHVSAFIRHLNPLTFLTAYDIMHPYQGEEESKSFSTAIEAKTPLIDLIRIMNNSSGNIAVVEKETLIGVISSKSVLQSILLGDHSEPCY